MWKHFGRFRFGNTFALTFLNAVTKQSSRSFFSFVWDLLPTETAVLPFRRAGPNVDGSWIPKVLLCWKILKRFVQDNFKTYVSWLFLGFSRFVNIEIISHHNVQGCRWCFFVHHILFSSGQINHQCLFRASKSWKTSTRWVGRYGTPGHFLPNFWNWFSYFQLAH